MWCILSPKVLSSKILLLNENHESLLHKFHNYFSNNLCSFRKHETFHFFRQSYFVWNLTTNFQLFCFERQRCCFILLSIKNRSFHCINTCDFIEHFHTDKFYKNTSSVQKIVVRTTKLNAYWSNISIDARSTCCVLKHWYSIFRIIHPGVILSLTFGEIKWNL